MRSLAAIILFNMLLTGAQVLAQRCTGIICPSSVTATPEPGKGGAVVNYAPARLTGECSGYTATTTPASGSFFPVGKTPIVTTIKDPAGNVIATCTNYITVRGTEPPVTAGVKASPGVVQPANRKVSAPDVPTVHVTAYPNPSAATFLLKFGGASVAKLDIRLYDWSGRLILSLLNVNSNNTVTLGARLRPGVYFAQVQQGSHFEQIKLIKQPD